ncbi:hypothetical protein GGR50DRAFT_695702 [Xylaria sp. CBS 124048]|nr:hypothetical protein GGR50DRAFT_695702 [Xylaria sp. CBS 124048]
MAGGDHPCQITISDSETDDTSCYNPIGTPMPTRQSLGAGQAESLKTNSFGQDTDGTGLSRWPSGTAKSLHDGADSSLARIRSPGHQTPKKVEVTVANLTESLRDFEREIGVNHAKLAVRLIHDAWKRDSPEPRFISKKDWFAGMKLEPVGSSSKPSESIRIKTKQVGQGKTGKQEKRERYLVMCIKTNQEATPRYDFHHVEIKKNILSPNTMLTYVPHLRDLADNEENIYRRWLENLEAMDKTSGFATLSRHEKVVKTIQKERATVLLDYLDVWLARLGIENCTKAALIRYVASQGDSAAPQQKSIMNSHNDNFGSPRTTKTLRIFVEAYDDVFNDDDWGDQAVPLRDVLMLDKSADSIVDSKKYMRDTPTQSKSAEDAQSVETFLETYSLLGCLVCSGNSCEHGEYGVDNERKRYSVELLGGFSTVIRERLVQRLKNTNAGIASPRKAPMSCGEECYLRGRPSSRSRPWNETEVMVLRSFHLCFYGTSVPVQCSTAVATGRPCWEVQRQMDKLDLLPPDIPTPVRVEVKSLPWYDRHRKMLIGDWQEHTKTHEHSRRTHLDPCYHDGPCDRNCPCVQNHVMCERFCRCTVENCANKFTGCACHSLGRTCMAKQKDRPCICILLNRECDPGLCGTCGATERAMPKNVDNDALYTTGCQNCALQRGKSKAVVIGKSKVAGYGLYATEDIAQDEFVIEYVGELISQDEGVRREARRGDVFDESSNSSYLFTLLDQEGIWVDAAVYGNLSRYINHQDTNCNVMPRIIYVNGEYRIKFTSIRDIKAGEELFFHYGENFPNLTKKLLEEGEKEEKRPRKAGGQATASENGEKGKKRSGTKAGSRKSSRKPRPKPKKSSSIPESGKVNGSVNNKDPANDHVDRKRKHHAVDSDSSEYLAGSPEGQSGPGGGALFPAKSHSASAEKPKRMRLANGTFVSLAYERDVVNQGGGGIKSEDASKRTTGKNPPEKQSSATRAGTNTDSTTPRVSRPRRHNASSLAASEANSSVHENSSQYTHTEARLELNEDPTGDRSPHRRRTRYSSHRGVASSPISMADDSASHGPMDAELSDSDLLHINKRRSRRSGAGDEEYTGGSWTDSDGNRHYGDFSDDDPSPVDRRRSRRRPARYDD